jgi:mannosyl-oligosaccharide alpha-1,3-glucosidase
MVAIVDPHIKRQETFPIYAEAVQLDILVKQPDAVTDFEGWCWTGSSAYVDFFLEKSWDWWQGLFKFDKWTVSRWSLSNHEDCIDVWWHLRTRRRTSSFGTT